MLGDFYEVRQRMAENPPCITKRHQREFGIDLRVGEGVFVLTASEVKRLAFSDFERSFLRPDYKTAALGRYSLPDGPTHSVLYLTRTSAPTLTGYHASGAICSDFGQSSNVAVKRDVAASNGGNCIGRALSGCLPGRES